VPTIATPRDPHEVRGGFTRWLAAREGADVEITSFTTPLGGGMSSETFLVHASVGAARARLVLRLPPSGEGLFPSYDLAAQARVLEALHRSTEVPVPRVEAYEPDPAPLGAPFLVMQEVDGRVPTDRPSYLHGGWVHDASGAEQERLHRSFLATVATIHRVDWAGLALDDLARSGPGTALVREVAWWESYLGWAARNEPATATRDALAWCAAHRPATEAAPSLLWGDVRVPNVVFGADFEPRAVLDWEMATIGPAEVDLGWYLAIHRMSAARGDLPGFLERGQALDWYEASLGRELAHDDLHWYEVLGAARSAAIMVRMGNLLHDLGVVEDRSLVERNPCTALLDELLR